MPSELKIGTRGSQLALFQANWVKDRLVQAHPDLQVTLIKIKTTGDKIQDAPLAKIGGKGLFVKEIEEALLQKRIDLAVHSIKDVPTEFPEGLHLSVITKREDPRDVLISKDGKPLKDLPKGAKIGTSSLRRQAQLLHFRSDFELIPLRGNLDTRLKKLKTMNLDAIVLALAGVKRLGFDEKITEIIPPEVSLPAIGQGALGIETRMADQEVEEPDPTPQRSRLLHRHYRREGLPEEIGRRLPGPYRCLCPNRRHHPSNRWVGWNDRREEAHQTSCGGAH